MPLYGTAQSGSNPPPNQGLNITSLSPGDQLTLFGAGDAIASGSASVSFTCSPLVKGLTFNVSGCAVGSTVHLQCAAADLDADYYDYATVPQASGNGAYSDIGCSPFRRALCPNFANGDVPIVTVKAQ